MILAKLVRIRSLRCGMFLVREWFVFLLIIFFKFLHVFHRLSGSGPGLLDPFFRELGRIYSRL